MNNEVSTAGTRPSRAIDRAGGVRKGRPGRENERGATILIVALSLTGLISVAGLGVDQGEIWLAKQRGQAIADAAALAAAKSLPAQTATTIARSQTAADQVIAANNTSGWQFVKDSAWYSNPTTIQNDDGTTTTIAAGNAAQIRGYVLAPSPFGAMLGHMGTAGNGYN